MGMSIISAKDHGESFLSGPTDQVTLGGKKLRPTALLRRAERWRPWRAYAAQHLWAADAAPDSAIKEHAS